MTLIICAQSGTVLYAGQCYIIPDDAITEEELESSSDSEMGALAKARGRLVTDEIQALDACADLLNNEQWSSDHLSAVADTVRATGRTIDDNFFSSYPE